MPRANTARIALAALLSLASACDGGTDPEDLSVAGTWQGTALLPNAFSTTMSLTQTGSSVTGTMRISGAFIDQPLTGTLDATDRTLAWGVVDGCELWGGDIHSFR